jgi:hypothetical protein
MVCEVPAVHWNVHGAVQAVPSTVSARPAGDDVTVIPEIAVNVAVTVAGAFMGKFCGVVVPVNPPVKPAKV